MDYRNLLVSLIDACLDCESVVPNLDLPQYRERLTPEEIEVFDALTVEREALYYKDR